MPHAPLQDCCFGFFYKLSITVSSQSPQFSKPAALQKQVGVQPLQILSCKSQRHRGAATSGDAQTVSLGHSGSRLDVRVAASTKIRFAAVFRRFWKLATPQPADIPGAAPQPPRRSAPGITAPDTHPRAGAASRKHCCRRCEQHCSVLLLQRYFLGCRGVGIPGERHKAAPASPGTGRKHLQPPPR